MTAQGKKYLNFQMSITADLSVESYIEIAEHQKKFQEAVVLLAQNFGNVDFQIKQKRNREQAQPVTAPVALERRRQALPKYEDL
jgi:hypothetical protein